MGRSPPASMTVPAPRFAVAGVIALGQPPTRSSPPDRPAMITSIRL
jgi:hypothetical protein